MPGNKLGKPETDSRVNKCLDLRYNATDPILFKDWIKYCKNEYGDKSEQQYSAYWAKAKEQYDERWRTKLNAMLDPAMGQLLGLLASDDEKIRSRAVDQIVKYTGNDIEKIEAKIDGNIQLNWGDEETGYGKEL
jgi:hypothetical protein